MKLPIYPFYYMSTTCLSIRSIDKTVPTAFVHPAMGEHFELMVKKCGVAQSITAADFSLPPVETLTFIPIAYNLLVDALTNEVLFAQLRQNSLRVGYWFFNMFTISPALPIVTNPALGIVKGITKGLDQFTD